MTRKTILLCQNAPAEIPGTAQVLPHIHKALEAYRASRFPIIHVIHPCKEDGSNADLCRREAIENGAKIAAPNSEGAELVRELRPSAYTALDSAALLAGRFQAVGEQEWVMYKPRWGAFYQTGLELFLRERGIDTLVFAGCNFPNCPRTSILRQVARFSVIYSTKNQAAPNGAPGFCLFPPAIPLLPSDCGFGKANRGKKGRLRPL
ncbi:cysteine hydrolase family protein [Brevibacillus agri]|uniref:cysteine hydrolase family protein n=1 Tax=Brevibacillus agri TaxID=51101 RepID=UPI001EE516F7|nr:isochorismatase family cysteine hydrolase [Brevibacillus agri]MCG5251633.1 cysteine hydrolase [Brevibacillus agri]